MRFTTALTVVAIASSHAAALNEHGSLTKLTAVGHCGVPGEKCYEAKHHARAIANALTEHTDKPTYGISAFCGVEGSKGCNEKWAHVNKIGAAAEKAQHEIMRREAEAEAEARKGGWINYCGVPGSSCSKKRETEADADARKGGWINYCGVPGSSCSKKRDAAPRRGGWINYCGVPGSSCSKKREAEADADARKGGWINYCGVPGSSCSKRRAIDEVQEAIRKFNPAIEKEECHQPGQPCDLIIKAHKAFRQSKREAEARRGGWINYCGVPGSSCAKKRDAQLAELQHEGGSELAQAYLQAFGHSNEKTQEAESESFAPHGASHNVARAIDELEAVIDEAVAST